MCQRISTSVRTRSRSRSRAGAWTAEASQLRPDPVLPVEDAAPDRLGRVGREHRDHVQALQQLPDRPVGQAGLPAAGEERLEDVGGATVRPVPVQPLQLGQVDQLEVGGEGANQATGGGQVDALEDCCQLRVVLLPR